MTGNKHNIPPVCENLTLNITLSHIYFIRKEALLMDMLVVKKNKDVAINKNIGQIFKRA